MTIKVLGKEFNVVKDNAGHIVRELKGMFFDAFKDDEMREIADAIMEVENAFPGTAFMRK